MGEDVRTVRLVVEVTREDAVPGAGPDYWAPAWRAEVWPEWSQVDDGMPLAVAWSGVGPDDAVSLAFGKLTLSGELGGPQGRGWRGRGRYRHRLERFLGAAEG